MNAPTPKPIRSPSYPNMSLSEAVTEATKIEAQYRLSPVDRGVAAKIVGYSSLSGPANKALAALAQYGLVDRAGKGEMRVTTRAQAIIHPDNEAERRQHLRAAAFEPQLFRDLQERWPNMIPPEDGIASYLSRQGFNQSAIRPASKAYIQTLLFLQQEGANDSHGPKPRDVKNDAKPDGEITYGGARVGDWIDYESGGAIANEKPMRVRSLSEDEAWVFVDGSEAGLEMEQVIVREAPEDAPESKRERPMLPLPSQDEQPKPGSRKAMFPLLEGDVTLIFPSEITADGLEVLSAYLEVFLQREIKEKTKQTKGGAS
jgi:hypothetical protein